MSDEVLREMIRQHVRLRFPQSVFSWQGGEPTLCGLAFYERVVEFQMKYGAKGQVIGNSFQTNGLLLDDEWCKFFARYKFFIGLSLDGPRELHDSYRKGTEDTPTPRQRQGVDRPSPWERTVKAAGLLAKHKVEFNILSVITRESEKMAKDLFKWFLDNGFRFLQFIPCVEILESGEITPYSVTPQGFGQFLCELFDIWWANREKGVSIRTFDAVVEFFLIGRPSMCVFSSCCDGYLVVEHNGNVYPCDFFVKKDRRLGNLMKTPLDEIYKGEAYKKFGEEKGNVPDGCKGCEFFPLCNGGCQKDRIDPKTKKTYLCPAYKAFFSHASRRLRVLAEDIRRRQR